MVPPELLRALLKESPADTRSIPERPLTCTAVRCCVNVPSPSSPFALFPQDQTVPSVFAASVCPHPPASAPALLIPLMAVGVIRLVVVPSPSWPNAFQPHAHAVRSPRIASE